MNIPTLSAFNRFSQKYEPFPEATLRDQRFYEEKNQLKEFGAFVEAGRRVLVHEERYFLALELKNTGEFDSVIELMRQARKQGRYLSPEDALAQIRGGMAA